MTQRDFIKGLAGNFTHHRIARRNDIGRTLAAGEKGEFSDRLAGLDMRDNPFLVDHHPEPAGFDKIERVGILSLTNQRLTPGNLPYCRNRFQRI